MYDLRRRKGFDSPGVAPKRITRKTKRPKTQIRQRRRTADTANLLNFPFLKEIPTPIDGIRKLRSRSIHIRKKKANKFIQQSRLGSKMSQIVRSSTIVKVEEFETEHAEDIVAESATAEKLEESRKELRLSQALLPYSKNPFIFAITMNEHQNELHEQLQIISENKQVNLLRFVWPASIDLSCPPLCYDNLNLFQCDVQQFQTFSILPVVPNDSETLQYLISYPQHKETCEPLSNSKSPQKQPRESSLRVVDSCNSFIINEKKVLDNKFEPDKLDIQEGILSPSKNNLNTYSYVITHLNTEDTLPTIIDHKGNIIVPDLANPLRNIFENQNITLNPIPPMSQSKPIHSSNQFPSVSNQFLSNLEIHDLELEKCVTPPPSLNVPVNEASNNYLKHLLLSPEITISKIPRTVPETFQTPPSVSVHNSIPYSNRFENSNTSVQKISPNGLQFTTLTSTPQRVSPIQTSNLSRLSPQLLLPNILRKTKRHATNVQTQNLPIIKTHIKQQNCGPSNVMSRYTPYQLPSDIVSVQRYRPEIIGNKIVLVKNSSQYLSKKNNILNTIKTSNCITIADNTTQIINKSRNTVQTAAQMQRHNLSQMSPYISPQATTLITPQVVPRLSPQVVPRLSPQVLPRLSPQVLHRLSTQVPLRASPSNSRHIPPQLSDRISSQISPQVTPQILPRHYHQIVSNSSPQITYSKQSLLCSSLQTNSPQLNSPQLNSPQINSPQCNSPQINSSQITSQISPNIIPSFYTTENTDFSRTLLQQTIKTEPLQILQTTDSSLKYVRKNKTIKHFSPFDEKRTLIRKSKSSCKNQSPERNFFQNRSVNDFAAMQAQSSRPKQLTFKDISLTLLNPPNASSSSESNSMQSDKYTLIKLDQNMQCTDCCHQTDLSRVATYPKLLLDRETCADCCQLNNSIVSTSPSVTNLDTLYTGSSDSSSAISIDSNDIVSERNLHSEVNQYLIPPQTPSVPSAPLQQQPLQLPPQPQTPTTTTNSSSSSKLELQSIRVQISKVSQNDLSASSSSSTDDADIDEETFATSSSSKLMAHLHHQQQQQQDQQNQQQQGSYSIAKPTIINSNVCKPPSIVNSNIRKSFEAAQTAINDCAINATTNTQLNTPSSKRAAAFSNLQQILYSKKGRKPSIQIVSASTEVPGTSIQTFTFNCSNLSIRPHFRPNTTTNVSVSNQYTKTLTFSDNLATPSVMLHLTTELPSKTIVSSTRTSFTRTTTTSTSNINKNNNHLLQMIKKSLDEKFEDILEFINGELQPFSKQLLNERDFNVNEFLYSSEYNHRICCGVSRSIDTDDCIVDVESIDATNNIYGEQQCLNSSILLRRTIQTRLLARQQKKRLLRENKIKDIKKQLLQPLAPHIQYFIKNATAADTHTNPSSSLILPNPYSQLFQQLQNVSYSPNNAVQTQSNIPTTIIKEEFSPIKPVLSEYALQLLEKRQRGRKPIRSKLSKMKQIELQDVEAIDFEAITAPEHPATGDSILKRKLMKPLKARKIMAKNDIEIELICQPSRSELHDLDNIPYNNLFNSNNINITDYL